MTSDALVLVSHRSSEAMMSGSAWEAIRYDSLWGGEMLRHPHEQLVERQVATGVDDGTGVIVHDQELVGLHRLPILLDEVGEHDASMILVAIEFDGHGGAQKQ